MNTAVLANLKLVQDALDSLRATMAKKKIERDALYTALHRANIAPPDREETALHVAAALDALTAENLPALRFNLNGFFSHNGRVECADRLLGAWRDQINNRHIRETGLIALIAPALKASIQGTLAAMEWPEGALSTADRQNQIEGLEMKIKAANEEFEQLQEQADRLGLK